VDYRVFATEIVDTGILSDPWLDGRERFRINPVFLTRAEHGALYEAAEAVAAAFDEAVRLCVAEPQLLERFFGLPPWHRLMWEASAPRWHGIARADVFLTPDGPRICEINCDTPSGEAEAVLLGRAAARQFPECEDPSAVLESRFCALVERLAPRKPPTVGIVYPTELTEDLSMIQLYRGWFAARGWKVVLGSPFNLRTAGTDGVSLLGTRCDVIVRHYKTDWWGERLPVWRDDSRYPDPAALEKPLCALLSAELARGCAIINPFGAVVAQNKRLMALLWEEIDRFSPEAQAAIRAYVPLTLRLEAVEDAQLAAEKDDWVLKSDYGCEGAEVRVGRALQPVLWDEALAQAVRSRWVAQRWFDTGELNYGVYLVAGEASGIFSRIQRGPTDRYALTAPTLVRP
jgi:glutathionylspermidine synthase